MTNNQEKQKSIPIDPDTVPTLHLVKKFDSGLAIYDIDESQESRKNMREIINTHLGKDANPWPFLVVDNNGALTKESEENWKYNSLYTKQVAFINKHLAAFSAENIDVCEERNDGLFRISREIYTDSSYEKYGYDEDDSDLYRDPELVRLEKERYEEYMSLPEVDPEDVLDKTYRIWYKASLSLVCNRHVHNEYIITEDFVGNETFYNPKNGLGISSSDFELFVELFNDYDEDKIQDLLDKGRISLTEFPCRLRSEFDVNLQIPTFPIQIDIVVQSTPDKTELCIAKKGQELPLIPLRNYIDRDGKVKIDAMKHDMRPSDLKIVGHIDLIPKQKR